MKELKLNNKLVGKFNLSDKNVHSKENYAKIGNLFAVMNYQYFYKVRKYSAPSSEELNAKKRGKGRRLVSTKGAIEARKREKDFEKFVNICKKMNIPFDVYMEFQFKHFSELFKQLLNGRKSLSFGYLISDSASERFEQCASILEKEFDFFGNPKTKKKKTLLNIKESVYFSAQKYYNRLKYLSTEDIISEKEAVRELEFLYKTKVVSNIYIMVSPLSDQSEYLRQVEKETKDLISVSQHEEAFDTLESMSFEDKEIEQYV